VIGLEFNKNEGVKVDLTHDIQNFTNVGKLIIQSTGLSAKGMVYKKVLRIFFDG
jgi:hypothetical protein